MRRFQWMRFRGCVCTTFIFFQLMMMCCPQLWALPQRKGWVRGKILDPQGVPVANAKVTVVNSDGISVAAAFSDWQGVFQFENVAAGRYRLKTEEKSFVAVGLKIVVVPGRQQEIELRFRTLATVEQAITVAASSPSVLTPDPAQTIVVHDQALDANPGRPGAPVSLPGLPIETASGGIKAPQYFSPGVAGDHGEPIAQFFQVGSFLLPNNLPANAHGNGYADPNVLIPATIEAVNVDGGAFNVREGNNSVDLAATYIPRQRFATFAEITGDSRDADLVAGWSPRNPVQNMWFAFEASYGNGFLDRLEHRQQYKLNGQRSLRLGQHEFTVYGTGYYGFSFIPGLIPLGVPVPGDTIDSRQQDRTHNFLAAAVDRWTLAEGKQLSFAAFYRNYGLALQSNFGDGLIRQSESRNVVGGEIAYSQSVRPWLSLLAGLDLRRDAPRDLDLQHADDEGFFDPVTSNNLTLSFIEPFVSLDGSMSKYFRYDVGVRQEEIRSADQDLINAQNSFDKVAAITLPKATITLIPPVRTYLPTAALSYGEAFHTEDPRIGGGVGPPALLAPSRAYQLVISKTVAETQLRLTLKRVSNSQELAKIDPDTGLQQNIGPSLNRVLSLSLQRNFTHGFFYASYAQADARDRLTGAPVPEAPRSIWDLVGSLNRLPWHLEGRGEFEYVKAKPLGDGFSGVPVREIRGAVLRPFLQNRLSVSGNFLVANGATGQTTEVLARPGDPAPFERAVGVPLRSYVSLSFTYYFGR